MTNRILCNDNNLQYGHPFHKYRSSKFITHNYNYSCSIQGRGQRGMSRYITLTHYYYFLL